MSFSWRREMDVDVTVVFGLLQCQDVKFLAQKTFGDARGNFSRTHGFFLGWDARN